jgi:hypothetical protein
MPYSQLYDAVQGQAGRISTNWLRERAIEFSTITNVKEQWSGLVDDVNLRGFYIEGPLGPPVPRAAHEALIVLSREMCRGPLGKHWRRLVYTKELMHVFDRDDEKANTEETFDIQIEKFSDPHVDMSPQFRAEQKAAWRALGALCQEGRRLEYKELVAAEDMSLEVLAATLRLPQAWARVYLREDFQAVMQGVLNDD